VTDQTSFLEVFELFDVGL